MSYEPSWLEVWISLAASRTVASRFYREYVSEMNLSGRERILEFGPGSGGMSRYLAPALVKGGHLTCLDVSSTWLERARKATKRYSNVSFVRGDIRNVKLTGPYDIVLVHFVLHDIESAARPAIVRSLVRLLAPDGRLYIREPIADSHGMPVDDIRGLMQANGLTEVQGESMNRRLVGDIFTAIYAR